jgi:hypothetical protein
VISEECSKRDYVVESDLLRRFCIAAWSDEISIAVVDAGARILVRLERVTMSSVFDWAGRIPRKRVTLRRGDPIHFLLGEVYLTPSMRHAPNLSAI